MPNFGGGRPPKLNEQQQEQLLELLREGQPWKKQEIQHLINEEFDVEFHPVYLSTFLTKLGLSYAIPRTKRPSRPENTKEILDERVADAFDEDQTPHNKRSDDSEEGWVVDEKICTDGGTVLEVPSLNFLMRPIHNPGTIHGDSILWMTHISPDRWFV